jgi:hypothetical protein
MKSARFAFGSMLFLAFFVGTSQAQVQRTFVSGLGSDSNPCSRTAPCRTFGQAIMGTNAGGEVIVLDSAGYGPVTITTAISIIAPPGAYAGISVFSGDGIVINAGSGDTVILRGLTVNNQGGATTTHGIVFNTNGMLHVESCVVNAFSNGAGIDSEGNGKLEVKDSILRGNADGIFIMGRSTVAVDQVRLEGNTNAGLSAHALSFPPGGKVTVRNSVASNNLIGFEAVSDTTADVELNIENCVASNNGTGIQVQGSGPGVATVRVSNSTVTDNNVGLRSLGPPPVLLSRGNNTVEGNTTNTSGTIGSYTAK